MYRKVVGVQDGLEHLWIGGLQLPIPDVLPIGANLISDVVLLYLRFSIQVLHASYAQSILLFVLNNRHIAIYHLLFPMVNIDKQHDNNTTIIPCIGGGVPMNSLAKKAIAAIALICSATGMAQIVDTYSFTMHLNVPRIYDNMQSLGYRKYQSQTLKGKLLFIYKDDGETLVKVKDLVNRTHRINGKRVTYTCYDYPYEDNGILVVGIGSNRTLKFT